MSHSTSRFLLTNMADVSAEFAEPPLVRYCLTTIAFQSRQMLSTPRSILGTNFTSLSLRNRFGMKSATVQSSPKDIPAPHNGAITTLHRHISPIQQSGISTRAASKPLLRHGRQREQTGKGDKAELGGHLWLG